MSYRGAGGTPGGEIEFVVGLIMSAVGAYLLTQQVTVTTSGWLLFGMNAFGLSLLPFLAGVGLLFFDAGSWLGRILVMVGLAIIFAGILMNMTIYFQSTSLFNTLMMLGLLAAGLGLLLRGLAPRRTS
jgi:hypothetical protein